MNHTIRRVMFLTVPNDLSAGLHERRTFFTAPPISFLWLVARLEQAGIDCEILDAHAGAMSLSEILTEVGRYKPDMIGFSVYTPFVDDNIFLASAIKSRYPNTVVVFGGYHVNHHYEEVLEHSFIDFCVLGEGDDTLLELICSLNEKVGTRNIRGLSQRVDGRAIRPKLREPRRDLDHMPRLPYEKIANYRYVPWGMNQRPKDRFMTVISSLGCPMQCMFCDVGRTEGKRVRAFSVDRVVEDIGLLQKRLGVTQIEFADAIFTVNPKRVKQICALLLESDIRVRWTCSANVNFCDDGEMLNMMRTAGCEKIFYGIETGNRLMLRRYKRTDPDTVSRIVGMTKRAGIKVHASFIFGLPGETKETMAETVEFAKRLRPHSVSFSIAIPFRGTELYEVYKDKMFIKDYREFLRRATFRVPEYTPAYVEQMVVRAHRTFYLRPGYVLARLADIRSWNDLLNHARIAVGLALGKVSYKAQ